MMDTREAHGSPFKRGRHQRSEEDPRRARRGVPLRPRGAEPGARDVERTATGPRRVGGPRRGGRRQGRKLLEQLDDDGAATITTKAELFEAGTKVATRKAMQRAMDYLRRPDAGHHRGLGRPDRQHRHDL